MTDRKRLKLYAAAGLGLELAGVACGLTANLTRHFDGTFADVSRLLAGAGLVALGMALELFRRSVKR